MNEYMVNKKPVLLNFLKKTAAISPYLAASVFYGLFVARASLTINGERFFSLFDDAMISMRYARNLAEHAELVWNAGAEKVEGYTNFFWTLLMALVHFVGLDASKASLPVIILGAVCILLTAFVSGRITRLISPQSQFASPLAAALVLFSFPLIFWSLRGMEVGFLCLLLIGSVYLALQLASSFTVQRLTLITGMLCIALLTRLDAIIFCGIIVCFMGLFSPHGKRALCFFVPGTAIVLCLLAHTAFRYFYYGDLLPNTYYLKMTGIPAAVRILAGLKALGAVSLSELWPFILTGLPFIFFRECRTSGYFLICLLFLCQCFYSSYVGGDAWEVTHFANRYITTGLPPLFILSALTCEVALSRALKADFFERLKYPIPFVLFTLFFMHTDMSFFVDWRKTGGFQVDQEARVVKTAINIKNATTPDAKVAVVWAGAIPYFSERFSIDLLGKNDRYIAHLPCRWFGWFYPGHMKWDYRYSIDQFKPDVVHELWFPSQDDKQFLLSKGYAVAENGIFYTSSRVGINAKLLGSSVY